MRRLSGRGPFYGFGRGVGSRKGAGGNFICSLFPVPPLQGFYDPLSTTYWILLAGKTNSINSINLHMALMIRKDSSDFKCSTNNFKRSPRGSFYRKILGPQPDGAGHYRAGMFSLNDQNVANARIKQIISDVVFRL